MDKHEAHVIIIGGGAAGLSAAGALKSVGVESLVLDKKHAVGASWSERYDALHLHTVRRYSGLAYYPIPKKYPRYMTKDQFASYLRDYADHFALELVPACNVLRIVRNSDFRIETSQETWRARIVVVATGHFGHPIRPAWPGRTDFAGELIHSVDYRNPDPFVAKRVLVVGAGNSGAEIAATLAASDTEHVAISIRTPPPVVPRDFLGMPVQVFGQLLAGLPPRIADGIGKSIAGVATGDLTRYGLAPAAWQPFSAKRIPIIDVGFIKQLKRGRLHVRPNIARLSRDGVMYDDDSEDPFDVVIMATGFRPGIEDLLGIEGLLRPDGLPRFPSGDPTSVPGLYFMGYTESHRGHLFEANRDSKRLAKAIQSYLQHK